MHDVIVANGRYLGGGMKMLPEAEPDDGLFDVLLIGDVTKRDLAADAAEDLPRHAPAAPEGRAAARARRSTVESAEPLPVELDGEQPGTTPVRFEIVPQRAAAAGAGLGLRLGLRLGGCSAWVRGFRRRLRRLRELVDLLLEPATRRSSASRPRTFFCRSSTRSLSWFAFSTSSARPASRRSGRSRPRPARRAWRRCPVHAVEPCEPLYPTSRSLLADDDRRSGRRDLEEPPQHRVADADAAVRDRMPDRPGLVRPVDRDRAALRPAGEHRRVGRDADRRRAERRRSGRSGSGAG